MDVENMLEVEENLDSLIRLDGNFFIMDSEQLISNPFHEMQQDAMNEANKKNTMTEKLTIVKNNVCENHYQMAKNSLDRQQVSRLKQLHDNSNRLRHEVKLLDLDRQRHTVEVKKRLEPERDHSYDEGQIHNTERRLGANIASFYLEKKLKYPMRLRSMKDIRVTPTISKARAKIRTSDLNKQMEEARSPRPERAQTAKTTSTAQTCSSVAFRRRGSRSAPLYTRNARSGGSTKTLFPAIGANKSRAGALSQAKEGSVIGSERDNNLQQHNIQQVKFAFDNPLKILASSDESANMFARSSYYPGSTKAVNFGYDSSEDDDLSEPERVDLRAILFPDDKSSLGPTPSSLSHHQIWALRKAQGPAPKLTTDKKQEEANNINAKIDKFLEKLALARKKKRRKHEDSDSSDDDDDDVNNENYPTTQKIMTASTGTSTDAAIVKHDENKVNNNNNDNNNKNENITKSLTAQSQTQTTKTTSDSKGVDTSQHPQRPPVQHENNHIPTSSTDVHTEESISADSPRKYSWRCIRGKQSDGKLRGTYQTEDLVIQALTGVPISNAISTHVPMHSASRAMRHTATFKMHKIVEKLINDRTKYERHQVEEIKRQQLEAADSEAPSSQLTRKMSKATTVRQMSR